MHRANRYEPNSSVYFKHNHAIDLHALHECHMVSRRSSHHITGRYRVEVSTTYLFPRHPNCPCASLLLICNKYKGYYKKSCYWRGKRSKKGYFWNLYCTLTQKKAHTFDAAGDAHERMTVQQTGRAGKAWKVAGLVIHTGQAHIAISCMHIPTQPISVTGASRSNRIASVQ